MSPKLRIPVVATILVVVVVLGAIISETDSLPALPGLPKPNGYDDLVKAGDAIMGDTAYSDLNESELQSLVTTNAESLHLLEVGLSRRCSVPTAQVLETLRLSSVIPLIRLAQLKAAEGRLAEMQGRQVKAAECYLVNLQLGNEICRGGFLIDTVGGNASQTIGGIRLAKLVHQLTPAQSLPVIQKLEAIDSARVHWSEVSRNESLFRRRWALHHLRQPKDSAKGLWEGPQKLRNGEIKHQQAIAKIRLLATELALRCYLASQGQVPSRVGDLVPKYLQRVPVDPFTGQPLVYATQGTNWTLYCVGPAGGRISYDSP